jgi:hypothetical protein
MTVPFFKDKNYEHRAHITYLTVLGKPDGTALNDDDGIAVQCSGRIGWDYGRENHPFVQLYRGGDMAEAERVRDAHNAAEHPVESGA